MSSARGAAAGATGSTKQPASGGIGARRHSHEEHLVAGQLAKPGVELGTDAQLMVPMPPHRPKKRLGP